jgi:hypothetical protein
MDVLKILWKTQINRLTKHILIKKITASELRGLFNVRCAVFRRVWFIFSCVLD